MTQWQDALDFQLDLASWVGGEMGQRFGMNYFGSAWVSGKLPQADSHKAAYRMGARWAWDTGHLVAGAQPVVVDPDMMTVLEAAVQGFQPEPLQESDLLIGHGLLILPRSLVLTDKQGRTISWRCAGWRVEKFSDGQIGLDLTLFHDMKDTDDFDSTAPLFSNIEEERIYAREVQRAPAIPTHVVTWVFGEMHPGSLGEYEDTIGKGAVMEVQRQFQGIMRLLTQHLADVSERQPSRQARKRAARAGLPNDRIVVVRLRRPAHEPKDGDPKTVHWSHRWLVGGHWRNQFYRSLGIHRQIWISPYVKGPEGLDLQVKTKRVYALVR